MKPIQLVNKYDIYQTFGVGLNLAIEHGWKHDTRNMIVTLKGITLTKTKKPIPYISTVEKLLNCYGWSISRSRRVLFFKT